MNTNATAQMVTSGGKGCMKQRLDTDQLTAEAAEKVLREALPEEWRGYREPLLIRVSAIIKDAIEKARGIKTTEYAKGWDDHVAAVRSSHAAHASGQDMLDVAWGIIANAGGGDWTKESKAWQEAAAKWRDKYKVMPAHASEQLSTLLSDIRVFLIRYRNGMIEHAEALKLQGRVDLYMSRAAHASDGGVCPNCGVTWDKHSHNCRWRQHASESEKLLPCPFCGSEAVMHDKGQFWVSCSYVGVCPVSLYDPKIHGCTYKEDAIRIWNKRERSEAHKIKAEDTPL